MGGCKLHPRQPLHHHLNFFQPMCHLQFVFRISHSGLPLEPLTHTFIPTCGRCLGLSRWDMVRIGGPFAFVIAPLLHARPIALCSIRLGCLTSLGAPYGKCLFNIFCPHGASAQFNPGMCILLTLAYGSETDHSPKILQQEDCKQMKRIQHTMCMQYALQKELFHSTSCALWRYVASRHKARQGHNQQESETPHAMTMPLRNASGASFHLIYP